MITRPYNAMSSRTLAEGNLNRTQMIDKLGKLGLNIKSMAGCTDAALREILRVLAERGKFAERRPDLSKFSESQRNDLTRIRQYIDQHAGELRRVGSDPAEMLSVFTTALANGYKAEDLIGRK